jgi:membrane-bound ClpP family serine protease
MAEGPPVDDPAGYAPTGIPPETPHPGRPDWRGEIMSLSGLNIIAGIWLIIAPWVLAYRVTDPRWNDVVFGIIIAVIAFVRAFGAYREEGLSWINALIGVWLFVAAFTIDRSGVASGNDIILGVIVFLLAAGSAEATADFMRRRDLARGPRHRGHRPIGMH